MRNFSQDSGSSPFSSKIFIELVTRLLTSVARFEGAIAAQSSQRQGLASASGSTAAKCKQTTTKL